MKFVEFIDYGNFQPHSGKASKKVSVQPSTVTAIRQKADDSTLLELTGGSTVIVAGSYDEVKKKLEEF